MSEEKRRGRDEPPRLEEPARPAPPPSETEGIGLSIEERGMVVAPDVPLPTNKVNVGNLPSADARPADGDVGGRAGGEQGGAEGPEG